MKDFILNTLNKNKAEGCYIVKKSGPQKPQPAYTVNERGHLVNPSTLQPIQKNTKSVSSSKPQTTPINSTKQIEPIDRGYERERQKKRQEIVDKMKNKKPEKKRQKPINNKELVEMIRQQEQAK